MADVTLLLVDIHKIVLSMYKIQHSIVVANIVHIHHNAHHFEEASSATQAQ